MENNAKYSLTKKSKTGYMARKTVLVAGVVVSLGIGTAVMYNSIQNDKIDEAAYSYDDSYSTYSEQIENVIGIDLSADKEDELNEIQTIREFVNDYLNENGLISKADLARKIYQEKETVIDWGLNVVKQSLANRNGNAPDDYSILPPDKGDMEYIANCKSGGNVRLSSNEIDIVEDVLGLQRLTDNYINVSENDTEKLLVNRINNIIKNGGKIITELSSSNKSK